MFRRTLERLSLKRGLARWLAPGEGSGASRASRTEPLALEALEERCLLTGFSSTDFLVADFNSGKIADFDQNFNFQGFVDTNMPGAVGLDFLANGDLVAAGRGPSQIKEYDSAGNVVTSFTNSAIGSPIDVKASSSNLLYVGSQRNGGLPEINLSGTTLRTVGTNNYDGVAVLPNNVLWAGGDAYHGKIDVIDLTTGNVTSTINLDHGQTDAESMFYSASTNTVLMTSDGQGVFERDTSGNFIREFSFPSSLASYGVTRGPNGDVYAANINAGSILHWQADGTFVGSIDISSNVSGPVGIVWAGNANPNFVLQNGTLSVHSTQSAGDFSLVFTDATHFTVTLGSESHSYDTSTVDNVQFEGMTPTTTAVVSDAFNTSTVRLSANQLHLQRTGFAVDVIDTPTIHAYGNASSTALLDNGIDGAFVGTSSYGQISASGFLFEAASFGSLYATAGIGSDSATFYLPAQPNSGSFVAASGYGAISDTGYLVVASGFHNLSAYAGADGQIAQLYLGDHSTLVGTNTYTYVSGPTGLGLAIGFKNVYGYADGSHTDSGLLYSVAHASLLINPAYSQLTGNGFSVVGIGFPSLLGIASGTGTDTAAIFAGANESVVGTPTYMSLAGGSLFAEALGYTNVTAHGTHGAGDKAWLYDSAGDDELTAQGNVASMLTPTATYGVIDFDAVDAVHSTGNDTASLGLVDYSLQLTGQWNFEVGSHSS